jgi:hypothetical protein
MQKQIRIALIFAGAAACSQAQWVNYRSPGIPRTSEGKPNLTAPAPRTSNGKPDFSGLWQVEPSPWAEIKPLVGNMNDVFVPGDDLMEFSKYGINILADFKPGEAPIRPEVAAKMHQHQKANETEMNPCLPGSITFMNLIPATNKWIQTPGLIVILQEAGFNFRQVYLDGRKPPSDALPLWFGYSVGKWEGDTLVVDTTGFNDKTVLDAFGNPHSDSLHLTERYHRRDYGHMDVQLTVDDPKIYTKPFTVKYTDLLLPDSDILEYVCEENEKDARHLAKQ